MILLIMIRYQRKDTLVQNELQRVTDKDFAIDLQCHHPISIKFKIVGCKYRC